MTSLFQKIKNSYFKSLKGDENFWVVLLGWGFGLHSIIMISCSSTAYFFKKIVEVHAYLEQINLKKTYFILLDILLTLFSGSIILLNVILILYPLVFSLFLLKNLNKRKVKQVFATLTYFILVCLVSSLIFITNLVLTIPLQIRVGDPICNALFLLLLSSMVAYIYKFITSLSKKTSN